VPSDAVTSGASTRANCISFASDCRRASTLGRFRAAGAAAAIMVNKRFASGSSGMGGTKSATNDIGYYRESAYLRTLRYEGFTQEIL
jgi:hypothetical protein